MKNLSHRNQCVIKNTRKLELEWWSDFLKQVTNSNIRTENISTHTNSKSDFIVYFQVFDHSYSGRFLLFHTLWIRPTVKILWLRPLPLLPTRPPSHTQLTPKVTYGSTNPNELWLDLPLLSQNSSVAFMTFIRTSKCFTCTKQDLADIIAEFVTFPPSFTPHTSIKTPWELITKYPTIC